MADMDILTSNEQKIEEYAIDEEPYYLPVGNEEQIFTVAFAKKLPLLLKGPTGCGKTRFVEYMAIAYQGVQRRRKRDPICRP